MYHVVGEDTVYQEDYFDLLSAIEVGMKITYNPGTAEDLLKNFTRLYSNGMSQVTSLRCLHSESKPLCSLEATCAVLDKFKLYNPPSTFNVAIPGALL